MDTSQVRLGNRGQSNLRVVRVPVVKQQRPLKPHEEEARAWGIYYNELLLLEQAENAGQKWPESTMDMLTQGSPEPAMAMSMALLLSISEGTCRDTRASEIRQVVSMVAELAQDAERLAQGKIAEAWNSFCDTSFAKGAGAMHKLTRTPEEWKPLVVKMRHGYSATEADNLSYETAVLHRHWKIHEQGKEPKQVWCPNRLSLQRKSPAEIREIAYTFSTTTCLAPDGFHPRHFALMTDPSM